jgi:hypothetical protein
MTQTLKAASQWAAEYANQLSINDQQATNTPLLHHFCIG